MPATVTHHQDQQLTPDPERVIGRLFLPSSEPPHVHRARDLVRRVLELDDSQVAALLPGILEAFSAHHSDLPALLLANAAVTAPPDAELSEARRMVLGAAFTCEYVLEGAALCNPSVMPHPDQSDLAPGELRVAVSLRAIGEGHISALEFIGAVVTADSWRFEPRDDVPVAGQVGPAAMHRTLLSALADHGRELDELTTTLLATMPEQVESYHIERALDEIHPDLLLHPEAHIRVAELRRWARAGYTVSFDAGSKLHQRVLLPAAEDESQGLEDARFTKFTHDDGSFDYRATYTAYDGRRIGNRLLISPDLQHFSSWPLSGPGARNKGMALFPRRVGGRLMALSRADGMTIGVTTAKYGYVWKEPVNIEGPSSPWQILQVGNASPPLETEHGWLVVTHGVGLMRTYSLGAMLLDLEDPTVVLAKLERPLLPPVAHGGYVPNVVFTCGAIIQGGRLFIPYGIGDLEISVASLDVQELIGEMTRR
ncbi:MAG: glycosylase [Propionibacteriaceae bacterium]|nr:glycosylase [Propionibacteriaceae bacterium]